MTDVNVNGRAMSRHSTFNTGPPPHYKLSDIKDYLNEGKFFIGRKARYNASEDFNWGRPEIVRALKNLKLSHFHKKEVHWTNPRVVVDYYKARDHFGEDIYTHFHVDPDEDKLIINSFKEI